MSKENKITLYKPFKIIYRYKNETRKVQYAYYLYLGNVPNNIRRILTKIKNLTFFQTLLELSPDEINILEKYYDIYWYENIFLSSHITKSKKIFESIDQKNKLIKKLGQDWIKIHIQSHKKTNLIYSYSGKVRIDRLKKQYIEDSNQSGGKVKNKLSDTDTQDDTYSTDADDTDNEDVEESDNIEESENIEENIEPEADDYDSNELEEMHLVTDDMDKDADKTKKILHSILETETKSTKDKNISFNTANDTNNYNADINDIYEKNYIFNQFIYPDDTILTIKKKICITIEKNKKFESSVPYFIPSRIYTWSEYTYNHFENNKSVEIKDALMLGKSWLRQNNILPIDVVPLTNFHDYEILKGNLGVIKESMNRYGSRIHVEDNNHFIINDYIDYITNNEIYFTDIYTELGKNYKPTEEIIKNLTSFYIKIYFTESLSDFSNILNYLNGNYDIELKKITQNITTIENDILLENKVMNYIEQEYVNTDKYEHYYKDNFITQTTTHVSLFIVNLNGHDINIEKETTLSNLLKFDLHRIFENYILSEDYPYIQYQPPDGAGWHKFRTISPEYDRESIQSKWLESNPYGISFKIKVNLKGGSQNKYISVKLSEYGRLEYKTQWKEEDHATFEDVNKTFIYIQNLIKKINSENTHFKIYEPHETDFKYAFINNIQSFYLPIKNSEASYIINHNHLLDFCRLFFPYISVVIEPKKRESVQKDKKNVMTEYSKYGTYLRYKRVSNYYNEMNIERRIRYFIKNYEYDEKGIVKEIAAQYNLTDAIALQKVRDTRDKYPYLKKTRNILKKFENIPRAKPSGVEVDIQGKSKENYKIRIAGARSQWQLNEILRLMNIVLYLYVDIYHVKNKDRLDMLDILKDLNNIAKRRNKVEEIVDIQEDVRTVKKITKLDKDRLGFRPEKGQNHWSRNCQNSGTKKRQPTQHAEEIDLIKYGYTYNKLTKNYEKKVTINNKEVILRSIKIPTGDKYLYYTCDLEVNRKYSYVGYLTKSKHPSGLCMPCCFKNDSFNTNNTKKRGINEKCANNGLMESIGELKNIKSDKIYILQETNKIQEGRFSFLPEYLDIFFNKLVSNDKLIKNHYLIQSKSGYYFKYGVSNQKIPYLSAVASILEKNYQDIITELFDNLGDILFTCLNNGDIKLRFGTIDAYKEYILNNINITHEFLDDLICYKYGINSYIFEKRISKRITENNVWIKYDDYVLICKNVENYDNYKNKLNMLIVKDNNLYFPIFNLQKDQSKKEKFININKLYNYSLDNIVDRINKYYSLNCLQNTKITGNIFYNSKEINEILNKLKNNNISGQIIDTRYKARYLLMKGVSKNTFLFPVQPSGCLDKITIYSNYNDFVNNISSTMKFLVELNKFIISNVKDSIHKFSIIPTGITYNQKIKDKYIISGLYIQENIIVPITTIRMDETEIKQFAKEYKIKNFMIVNRSNDDIYDREIIKGASNIIIDERIIKVNKIEYIEESFDRFKLELSNYLINNLKLKDELEDACNTSIKKTKDYLMKLSKNIVTIVPKIPKLDNYKPTNYRQLCNVDQTCSHIHCSKNGKTCQLQLTNDLLIQFTERLSNDIVYNVIKKNEILQKNNRSVSDIQIHDFFTSKKNEKLIKTSNLTINSILTELYGENNIPIIGKKKLLKLNNEIEVFPPKIYGNKIEQIVKNENGLYRTIINGFYWIKNKLLDIEYRNLGYECVLQNDIINLFKGKIINWILDDNNLQQLYKHYDIKNIPNLKEKLVSNEPLDKDNVYKYELYILADIINTNIIVFNQYDEKIFEFKNNNNSNDTIKIKYEIYNNVITKFYSIYTI